MGLNCCKEEEEQDEEHVEEEDASSWRRSSSRFSKRWRKSMKTKLQPSIFTKSLECADCMLVEIGEKSSFFGNPCDTCGKYPRTPYGNYED